MHSRGQALTCGTISLIVTNLWRLIFNPSHQLMLYVRCPKCPLPSRRLPTWFFFTIDRAGVNRLELVNKQKAKMSGVFGVSLLPVLQRSRPDLRVGLERVDGQALDECHLLTPGMVSMDDLQTMRVWKCLRLHYGVGYLLPTHLMEASQKALEALLHARRLQGGKLVLSHADEDGSDDCRTRVREALEALEQLGMVSCSSKQSRSSTWSFTSTGEKSIAVSVWIGQPVQALTRRQGVAIRDLTLFELLDVLQERCWTCQFPAARAPRASLAYTVGSEKICWLRPSTKSITLKYLLALLDAENHAQPVFPFQTVKYYDHILAGKVWDFQRRKKKALPFSFQPEAIQDIQLSVVTPEPLDGSGHMEAIADADSQPSASDRGESASDDGDEDCFEEDLVAGDVAELDVAEGGEDDGGDRSEEVSFQWRNAFLFTKIFNGPGGSWSGYQVSCKLHGGHHCRVGRSFHTHGGHDATLAKMKTWCVLGSARSVKTAHQHKFDVVFPDDPMCDVDLEAYPLPPLDDAASARSRRKRQRLS